MMGRIKGTARSAGSKTCITGSSGNALVTTELTNEKKMTTWDTCARKLSSTLK
jgi:hypothetical protein